MRRLHVSRWAAALLSGLLVMAAPVAPLSEAAADESAALISLDGRLFAETSEEDLFAGTVLIPGSSASSTLWIRNDSSVPAELRVAVLSASSSSPAFLTHLTLQAGSAHTPAGAPVPLDRQDRCAALLAGEVLEPGTAIPVQLALSLSPEAGNDVQGASADVQLGVSLADASRGAGGLSACGFDSGAAILQLRPGLEALVGASGAAGVPPTDHSDIATTDPAALALDTPPRRSTGGALPTLALPEHAAGQALVAGSLLLVGCALILMVLRRRRSRDEEK